MSHWHGIVCHTVTWHGMSHSDIAWYVTLCNVTLWHVTLWHHMVCHTMTSLVMSHDDIAWHATQQKLRFSVINKPNKCIIIPWTRASPWKITCAPASYIRRVLWQSLENCFWNCDHLSNTIGVHVGIRHSCFGWIYQGTVIPWPPVRF